MENVDYAAMVKDRAMYVKGSWNQEVFVALLFGLMNFIGVGPGA